VEDYPVGVVRLVLAAGRRLAVGNAAGRLFAVDDACLHRGGSLADGHLDGSVLTCPMHWWRYDVRTGGRLGQPEGGLCRYPVRMVNDEVRVTVPPPIDVLDDYGRTGTIGRFWTPTFGQAYLQLQRKLAARYDATPELLVTQVTRCTTIWSEPFLRQGRTTESVQNLLDAGFTATLDEQCHRDQVNAHKLWTTTRSGLSFNPYQRILADTTIKNDTVFSEQMMDYCRTQLGPRCVLENHSIRDTQNQGPSYDRLYSMLDARGGAIAFQTAAPDRVGDLNTTLQWAIDHGAANVELPISYRTTATPTTLTAFNRHLNTNATAASTP